MREFNRDDAQLMAASEILPGESRDLSRILANHGTLREAENQLALSDSHELIEFLYLNLDVGRIEYWEKQLNRLRTDRPRAWMVTSAESDYPANLKAAYDHPPFLFVDGSLESGDVNALSIAGSRAASNQGCQAAREIGQTAAREGITVVSGLARGIDAAAHEGALSAGGRTIAVLGHGITRLYPKQHENLAERIRTSGCLMSQFRPDSPPTGSTFPMRNTVISGLSCASLIVEANERSGTRVEADAALRQGRYVILWEPLLGGQSWARRYSFNVGVHWASTMQEVLKLVQAEPVN